MAVVGRALIAVQVPQNDYAPLAMSVTLLKSNVLEARHVTSVESWDYHVDTVRVADADDRK